ncbi:MAG: glycoside hydrolase family 2 TIM barrel-domain containing protein [Anaerolineae bacterium]|nr:hypothetical protein [Thermoflexales bacterium]MDW8407574.1 glycoside hydrolase family 2 TIM barrel-domain containing protein [Anaerolineae bacterium]
MRNAIPRPEHPRPQWARTDWQNLNGEWEFEIDHGLSGLERGMHQNRLFAGTITIPFCPESELSGIGNKDFMAGVWYRRAFTLPVDWKDKRILLHFGAVDYAATVWLNGQLVGRHRGGYASFTLEITPYVTTGPNTLTVFAADDTRSPLQPTGKQSDRYDSYSCFYTRTTGIWQTVWLEAVPTTYLRRPRYFTDIHSGSLTVHIGVDGLAEGLAVHTQASAEGAIVAETTAPISGNGQCTLTVTVPDARLWEPGRPFLYDLTFTLRRDEQVIDRVQSYFGLREVRIAGKRVLINNRSVFQRLILDQGFYPDGIYTAPSDDALRRDIELSMAMGFNGARLHQKVFEERFLYWADRLGYLVWGEFPSWGLDAAHPQALEYFLPEWIEVLERDFNHPCIIGWCPFNETPTYQNPELLRAVYRITKAFDPTRPVIDTSGYVHVETDIYDCHNYEQDPARFAQAHELFKMTGESVWRNFPQHDAPYQGQPYFVSEYGGIWWNPGQIDSKSWGYGDRPHNAEEFLARYKALTETLLFNPNMFGFCYTQLTDVEQEVNGLYTYDRRPKFEPAIIRHINTQKAAIED